MKKVMAIAMLAFLAACGNHSHEDAVVKKEFNVAEMTAPTTLTVRIDGMTCAMGCAKAIEKALYSLPGVVVSSVDFEKEIGTFSYEAAEVKAEELIAAIEGVNNGAYKVTKDHVQAGIVEPVKEEEAPAGDVEALHTEKEVDEASV